MQYRGKISPVGYFHLNNFMLNVNIIQWDMAIELVT